MNTLRDDEVTALLNASVDEIPARPLPVDRIELLVVRRSRMHLAVGAVAAAAALAAVTVTVAMGSEDGRTADRSRVAQQPSATSATPAGSSVSSPNPSGMTTYTQEEILKASDGIIMASLEGKYPKVTLAGALGSEDAFTGLQVSLDPSERANITDAELARLERRMQQQAGMTVKINFASGPSPAG